MTWRYWQNVQYEDGTSEIVTYLMPVLEVPFDGVFNDYSDGSAVEFTVDYYHADAPYHRVSINYDNITDVITLVQDIELAGAVLISVTQKPATPEPTEEPNEPEPDPEA